MTIIVQDPYNPNTTANCYISIADARIRASVIGASFPDDDTEAEQRLLVGMQYVDSRQFVGREIIPFQSTQWPREQIYVYRDNEQYEYPVDQIPQQVIDALLWVVAEDNVYSTTTSGQRLKRKKIDVIEKEYFDDSNVTLGFKSVTRADSLLSQFVYQNPNFAYVV